MAILKITNKTYLLPLLIIIYTAILCGCGLYYDYGSSSGRSDNDASGSNFIVKEVVDGDTIILSDNSRVRLIGINTPEYGMYFYGEAREVLEAMVLGKEVVLEKELATLTENSIKYSSYVKLLSSKINVLRTIATQGRR